MLLDFVLENVEQHVEEFPAIRRKKKRQDTRHCKLTSNPATAWQSLRHTLKP